MSQTALNPRDRLDYEPDAEPNEALEDDAQEEDDKEYDDAYLSEDQLEPHVNLADLIDETDLNNMGHKAIQHIEIDNDSRSEWLEINEQALDLAMQVSKQKTYPHNRASNVVYPLITTAAIQFAQRAYPAIVPGNIVVDCVVIGDDSGMFEVQDDPQTGVPIFGEQGPSAGVAAPAALGGAPGGLPSPPGAPPQQQGGALAGDVNPPLGAPPQPDGVIRPPPSGPQMVTPPGAKAERASRVSRHMSWQCLFAMPEWETTIDQLLAYLPIAGCAFRKIYYNRTEKRPMVEWYPGDKFIINNKAKSIQEAARFSIEHEFYPFQIKEKELAGEWLEFDINELKIDEEADESDDQAPRKFYEHYCRLDLDGSGYAKPFIMWVHEDGKVVRIERNWAEQNEDRSVDPIIDFVKYSFLANPRGGFYDVGFGWLLSGINETLNTSINQLLDAGHWQNAPTGFLGRGIRLNRAGDVTMEPNKFISVDTAGEDLHKNIYMYQHPGPSPVLFNMLNLLIDAGQQISSVQDIMQGKMDTNIAPTTAVTLVEQGMTTFTSIFKRVHRSLKKEFEILYRINRETLQEHRYAYADVLDDPQAIAREDYLAVGQDIRPVTDPKMVSDQVKRAKASFLLDLAKNGLIDQQEATKRMLEAFNIAEPEKLMIPPPQPPPPNPADDLAIKRMQIENQRATQDMENERVDSKRKADETLAKIMVMRADAVKKLAEAEAAEDGTQLAYYQQQVADLDVLAAQQGPPQPQ